MKLSEMLIGKKGSLFHRYYGIFFFALLFCTFMLGITMIAFSAQLFREEKEQVLSASVEKAAEITETNLDAHDGLYVSSDIVEKQLELIEKTTGATVFFCDVNGNIRLCSEVDNCSHKTSVIPVEILQNTAAGTYSGLSNLGAFLSSANYAYGRPFIVNGMVYGFFFAVAPITDLFSYLEQIGVVFLISTALMLLAAFFVVSYVVSLSTEPLRNISDAVSRFGSGDMTARAHVQGDDEIAQLAQGFNQMADSIEELEQTRRSFVANVSHELRTPMTTISGYIDGILDGTIPKSEQEHYLTITASEVKRLARLSQSLLDIARMEANNNINLVDMNVWDVIINVMLSSERRITDKEIEVGDLDPTELIALCDPDMLHEVVYNLVDNAIKFTPKGGTLDVSAEKTGSDICITIRNSGDGISSGDLPHLFERFYKSDKSRALDKTGTGLGLYIVKTLVERMNGSIRAESVEGEYAAFIVTLPCPVPVTEPEAAAKESRRKNLFIGGSEAKNETT